MAGVDEELGDVGLAVQRARDRTEQMQAQAGALEELAELRSTSLSPGDAAQRTLDQMSGGGAIEDELARLKGATALPGPLNTSPATSTPATSTPPTQKAKS